MIVLFFIIILIESNEEMLSFLLFTTSIIAILILIFVLYIKYNKKLVHYIKSIKSSKISQLLYEINYEAINGMSYFKNKIQIAKSLIFLIVGWMIVFGIFYILSYPFVEQLNLPKYASIYFLVFSAIALSLPSAPAGIGVVHYGLYLAVQILMGGEIPSDQVDLVATLIISLHLIIFILDVIVGGLMLLIYRQKSNIKLVNDILSNIK